jgi:hypothetical protein
MPEGERVDVGDIISPDYLRPQYANFANVSHTPYDFRIVFGLVSVPRTQAEIEKTREAGSLSAAGVADLLLPVGAVPGLIAALTDQYDRYLKTYGLPGLQEGEERP